MSEAPFGLWRGRPVSTRDEMETLLHSAEGNVRNFLGLLKEGEAFWRNPRLGRDQIRELHIVWCEDWLQQYEKLDAVLEQEAADGDG